ncbi:hypothetical protein AcV7_007265 [Taiwanofungus camphoratus]|nr:hypothetical protein AcV7_007265 [Antrodia cinnamomea]
MSAAVAVMSIPDDLHDALSLKSNRPHSIDLTLELERQLECESLPTSPNRARPQSLDTNVLASIVTQLRMSLDNVTKERDNLSEQLAEVRGHETDLKEALHTVSEKCLRLEADLSAARDKHKEDEESISMLRTKVEESRRGLMRLQTESRRKSQISNLALDLSREQSSFNAPPSSKRMSFTPLTGSPAGLVGHRRISSMSDPGLMSAPNFGETSNWPSPPRPPFNGTVDLPQSGRAPPANPHTRRLSGMFGFGSSPLPALESTYTVSEVDALRKELETIKDQLEETRHELSEVQEAKEASEMCIRALRTFIAENNVGEQKAQNSARPWTKQSSASMVSPQGASGPSRWGFKLWNTTSDSPSNTNTTTTAPSQVPSTASSSTPLTSAPVRKLGGLFSPRSSISSTSRPTLPSVPQEPIYNGSDTSSLADSTPEPVSPASSMPRASVLVQDGELMSLNFGSTGLHESSKTSEEEIARAL